ncbi:MAG: DUF177 domain-containing protein [Bacillota bacterium]|nr:DUF177 domain-containing protein [Bacillota bacterium]
MVLDIQRALKNPGEKFGLFINGRMESFEFAGDTYEFIVPLELKGGYSCIADTCIIKAMLRAEVGTLCARCLSKVEMQMDILFSEEFVREADSENPERRVYAGESIDLDSAIIENVILSLPIRVLCKQDCKGLCAKCGSNLNEGKCGCRKPHMAV